MDQDSRPPRLDAVLRALAERRWMRVAVPRGRLRAFVEGLRAWRRAS